MDQHMQVRWIDRHLEPKNPANPDYPRGVDLDLRHDDDAPSCMTELPYPAKRIGYYLIRCIRCGMDAVITTAGRADDPRSVQLPCKVRGTQK
jgi:hypothetical protein